MRPWRGYGLPLCHQGEGSAQPLSASPANAVAVPLGLVAGAGSLNAYPKPTTGVGRLGRVFPLPASAQGFSRRRAYDRRNVATHPNFER